MTTHPLAIYLEDCRARHKTGAVTPETSLYNPLETLLNAVGSKLKRPRVRCFMNLKDQDAGLPDGGLFTPDQFEKGNEETPQGQTPSRGVIECKPPKKDVIAITDTEQVSKYWDRYNQVLVTNYREFVLIGREDDKPVRHEYYRLAESEKEFWTLASHPEAAVKAHGDRLLDFLQRCLLRPAPLTEPKDVAWFLASYARDARGRIEHAAAHEKLGTIRKALEEALGLHVKDAEGEHFFQSTLVQTLFYGVFAAWVLWHRSHKKASERFDWEKASKYLHVPILRKLFRELTDSVQMDEWDNLTEVMRWAADTLNRVDRARFFEKFKDAEAVQYFYEPFLEAFDPEVRKKMGVWYTPPEIVRYMVGRVDQVLKSDFAMPNGLADENVLILDPCCGTGAFLVETLARIRKTLEDNGEGATVGARVKQAAVKRVFGFEILPAPFVVAHLQLGLALQDAGAPLDEKRAERAAVYLTNALTGWEPPTGVRQLLMFSELQAERDLAERVKQKEKIVVVIGNPPYNGFAGMPADEDHGLVDAYRKTRTAPKPQGQGLNDLYVRFLRIAERCITERHDRHGIVCYISNYSWLDGLSHTGVRERFLEEFDQIWIDSLNGDKYKTGKLTPTGESDPSVFSTPHNREGIQVGTAVAVLARTPRHQSPAKVRFRDFWGEHKRAEIEAHGNDFKPKSYAAVKPALELGLPLRPMTTDAAYTSWPLLEELFPKSFPGIKTSRDEGLVDIDRKALVDRMEAYFDATLSDQEVLAIAPSLMEDAPGFKSVPTRRQLLKRGILKDNVVQYGYRPFDLRWLYWEPETKLLDRNRPEYFPEIFEGNSWLAAAPQNRKSYDPPIATSFLSSLHTIERGANLFPMLLREQKNAGLFDAEDTNAERRLGEYFANISQPGLAYLNRFNGVSDHPHLFFHAIAILHAPSYAAENGSALRQDWPRVPLPAEREQLLASAELGRKIADLLDPEKPMGKLRPELKGLGEPRRQGGGQLKGDDFAVTARWGISGKGGICMPGKGKVAARAFDDAEQKALGPAIERLGPTTCDIYLNDVAFWKNVPIPVWNYTLGGYQVLKKWLSYREQALLGRTLELDEVSYFGQVVRRIAALILLGPELDANYRRSKENTCEWRTKPSA